MDPIDVETTRALSRRRIVASAALAIAALISGCAADYVAAALKNSKVANLNYAQLELSKVGEFVTVESAFVTTADIVVTNGTVHTIDTELVPPAKM